MIQFITKQLSLYKDTVNVTDSFDDLLNYLDRNLAVDTETTGLDALDSKVLLLQIGDYDNQFVIDLSTMEIPGPVVEYLEGTKYTKVLANSKFDYKMLKSNYDITMNKMFDVQLVEKLIYNGLMDKGFSLANLTEKYCDYTMSKDERMSFVGMKEGSTMTESQIIYSANDVKYPLMIAKKQLPMVDKYKIRNTVNLENEAVGHYGDMELNGITLDKKAWKDIYEENIPLRDKYEGLLNQLILDDEVLRKKFTPKYIQANMFDTPKVIDINWSSPDQILPIVKHVCLPDAESTAKETLEEHVYENHDGTFEARDEKYKLIEYIMNYRVYFKATSTYGVDFFKYIHPVTGRVHPTFKQLGAETGRLSCTKPNMQNIKAGSDYRKSFVPEKGYKFITADYSGCELRFIAEGSGDPVFVDAINNNEDVHSKVASMLYEVEVTKSNENKHLRSPAKNLNFGLAYGMGPGKLASKLRISDQEAKELMDNYFRTFPKIRDFLENNGKRAELNGFIRTPEPYGRIRWFKNHKYIKTNYKVRGEINRAGKNSPIQGANADLTKKSTILLGQYIRDIEKKHGKGCVKLVNQVHDEQVLEVREDLVPDVYKQVVFLMEMAANDMMGRIPMVAEASIDDCWTK